MRRFLYREFLRYVEFFQPKVFVMENVLGIRSASGREYFAHVRAHQFCVIGNAVPPLDDFGQGYAGCTEIHYFTDGVWRQL